MIDNCSSNPIGERGGKIRSLELVCVTQRFVPEGGGGGEGREEGKEEAGDLFLLKTFTLPRKVSRHCATVKLTT